MTTYSKSRILKTLIVFLMIVSFASCITQNEDSQSKSYDTEYKWLKLKGNIKYLEIKSYDGKDSLMTITELKFSPRKETIERKHINSHGVNRYEIVSHTVESYNENGTNIKSQTYKNGRLTNRQTIIDAVDTNGNVLYKIVYDRENTVVQNSNFAYNSMNNIKAMNAINWESREVTNGSFKYNDQNILIERSYCYYNREDVQIKKIVHKYNHQGQPILNEMYFDEHNLAHRDTFKYDSLNRLIEQIEYSSDTNSYWKTLINYDEISIKIDSTRYFYWAENPEKEKEPIYEEEIYEFDKRGNIVKQTHKRRGDTTSLINLKYRKNDVLEEEIITFLDGEIRKISYDEYGNIRLKQSFNSEENLISEEEWRYEYDSYQNITKLILLKNGKVERVHKRVYQYY